VDHVASAHLAVIDIASDLCGVDRVAAFRGNGKNTGLGLFTDLVFLTITMSLTGTGIAWKGARFRIAVPENPVMYRGIKN
jgi:hypothetical protein